MSQRNLNNGWLITVSLLAFVLWYVPVTRPFMVPLIYLNTHIHELWHALAAVGTGGKVEYIQVFASGGGVTPVYGSIMAITAAAGYTGASLVGGLLIASSRKAATARKALQFLGIALLVSMVLFVRGDVVGWIAGGVWTAAILIGAKHLQDRQVGFATAFLGAQQCLTSLQALMVLFHVSTNTDAHSDAMIMQRMTGVPASVWAMMWIVISLAAMGLGYRAAMNGGIKKS